MSDRKIGHVVSVHKDRVPSMGAMVMTECGEQALFAEAFESDPANATCTRCLEERELLKMQTDDRGVVLPDQRTFIVLK